MVMLTMLKWLTIFEISNKYKLLQVHENVVKFYAPNTKINE